MKEGLGDYRRPQRSIPPCSNIYQTQTFSRIPVAEKLLPAPRTFTRLTLPVVSLCKGRGIRMTIHLDDFLVLGSSRKETIDDRDFVLTVLSRAGFCTNLKKFHLEPTQVLAYTAQGRVFFKKTHFRQLGRLSPSLGLA